MNSHHLYTEKNNNRLYGSRDGVCLYDRSAGISILIISTQPVELGSFSEKYESNYLVCKKLGFFFVD